MNSKCNLCGSSGYLGLVSFECSNDKCSLFVQTEPTQKDNSQWSATQGTISNIYNVTPHPMMVPLTPPPPPAPVYFGGIHFGPISGTIIAAAGANAQSKCLVSNIYHVYPPGSSNNLYSQIANVEIILKNISYYGKEDVICVGGTPRNWITKGDKGKDIDIVLHQKTIKEFKNNCPSFFSQSQFKNISNPNKKYPGAFDVFEGQLIGEDVQLISIKDDIDFVDYIYGFDFGINKVWMNNKCEIHCCPEFEQDFNDRCLKIDTSKISPQTHNFKLMPDRIKKMKSYYPTWKVDII